jgi:CHAT domain-containing protein/tetratricopeptide (TPR) repeat protein
MPSKIARLIALFTIAVCFSPGAISQTGPDALWNTWQDEQQSDSTRLQSLITFTRNHYVFNQPDSALYFANLAYDFALQKKLPVFVSEALNVKGICYTLTNQYELALNAYHQSLEIDKTLGDKKASANKLNNIGIIYKDLGDFNKAAAYYHQALVLANELNNQKIAALAYNNMGYICIKQCQYKQAAEYFEKSLGIRRSNNDLKGMGISFASLGTVNQYLSNYPLAFAYLDSSLAIAEQTTNKVAKASTLFTLGDAYRNQGNYETALPYFQKALVLTQQLNDRVATCYNYQRLGDIYYILGAFDSALYYGLESFRIATETQNPGALVSSVRTTFLAYCHTEKTDSALYFLTRQRQLLDRDLQLHYFILSEQEKEEYFAGNAFEYEAHYDFALHFQDSFQAYKDTALNVALMTKGISLKSSTAMRTNILNSDDSLLVADYEKWIQLRHEIAERYAHGENVNELENKANELEKALIRKSTDFNDFDALRKTDWKNVRDALKPGEAAIEFVHFNNSIDNTYSITYAAFVITAGCEHPHFLKLCEESDLVEILGALQGTNINFVNSLYGTREKANTALYEKIWQPLEKHLSGIKTVYYSPVGLLHKISFASICKAQNVFLSDVYNFRQMGSTGNLTLQNETAFGGLENFLLMGGINYNSNATERETWTYLPGSLQETDQINAFLQQKKMGVNYFRNDNASEAVFKEKITSSTMVHIATHGFFFPDPQKVAEEFKTNTESDTELKFRGTTDYANWSFVSNKNPLMRSGIVLAGANDVWSRDPLANGEDGILTAQEVSNLDLRNTKLVVLSACETGLGDIHGSEGVFGLQRAFKIAGVKYLIMSLWQVPDKETAEFMQLFYTNLIKVKDIPLAFQKTQQSMRKKYNPYYWGAFVLIE